jgi:hypothetical protein
MNVENDEEASMIEGSKPKIRVRRMRSRNSLQTSETNESPTSERDEGILIATMSEDIDPVGGEGVQNKTQEIQETDDCSQLSSATKHSRNQNKPKARKCKQRFKS